MNHPQIMIHRKIMSVIIFDKSFHSLKQASVAAAAANKLKKQVYCY
jgi:hypothetical protein